MGPNSVAVFTRCNSRLKKASKHTPPTTTPHSTAHEFVSLQIVVTMSGPSQTVPVGWPAHMPYLTTPSYSRHLTPAHLGALGTRPPADPSDPLPEIPRRLQPGPCAAVRIVLIADPNRERAHRLLPHLNQFNSLDSSNTSLTNAHGQTPPTAKQASSQRATWPPAR